MGLCREKTPKIFVLGWGQRSFRQEIGKKPKVRLGLQICFYWPVCYWPRHCFSHFGISHHHFKRWFLIKMFLFAFEMSGSWLYWLCSSRDWEAACSLPLSPPLGTPASLSTVTTPLWAFPSLCSCVSQRLTIVFIFIRLNDDFVFFFCLFV